MIGALTYSELRAVYKVATQYDADIIAGSSEIVSGSRFVQMLSELEDPEPPTQQKRDKTKAVASRASASAAASTSNARLNPAPDAGGLVKGGKGKDRIKPASERVGKAVADENYGLDKGELSAALTVRLCV